MYIPTELTQRKIQQQIHGRFCRADCPGTWNTGCPCQVHSVFLLGQIMPEISKEMFPAVRADEREQILDALGSYNGGFDGCPGGHECACGVEAMDQVYRLIEAREGAATPVDR